MRADLPTGTVTFLFTDVEGSTTLLRSLGAEAYAETLAEHRRVVRDACAEEGGVEVDTQREGFFRETLLVAGRLRAIRVAASSACGLGASLIAAHDAERGAQLIGAAGSLYEELGYAVEGRVEEIRDRAIADGVAALGADAFAAARARGEAMTLEEVVELAR